MNNIQSILALGGLILLSLTALNFNSNVLTNSSVEIENKVYLTAFSLADDIIEEIKLRGFDERTLPFPTNNAANLTAVASLGPDAGEVFTTYDDVDDFNNYQRLIDAPHAENYVINTSVCYVREDDQDVVSSVQTFYKKVTVTVSSPYLSNNVQLSFIFTLK